MVKVLNIPAERAEYMIKNAKLMRIPGAEAYEWGAFKRRVDIDVFKTAELFLTSAEYCEVYINGEAVISNDLREYGYNRAYRVLDIAPFLKSGKNVLTVLYLDAGRTANSGFACEPFIDGEPCFGEWICRKDEAFNKTPHFITAGGEEICDMRKSMGDFTDPNADDAGFIPAEVKEIVLEEDVKLHKSMKKAPMERIVTPINVIGSYEIDDGGQRFSLACAAPTVFFSKFTANDNCEMSVIPAGGLIKLFIDGNEKKANEKIHICGGEHVICIFARGKCTFNVKCDKDISALIFKKAEFYEDVKPVFFYPFSERRKEAPISDDIYSALCGNVDFDGAPIAESEPIGLNDSITMSLDGNKSDAYLSCKDVLSGKPAVLHAGVGRKVVFDFGTEYIGQISLDIKGPRGCAVDFNAFELFEKSGERKMGPREVGRVILSGERDRFTSRRLRGFRYITLWIPKDCEITIYGVFATDKRYDVKDIGEFRSSDERLDEIYKMSTATVSLCMLDNYVDCPGYEQNPWVGDAGITGLANMICFGEREFDAEYLELIGRSMSGAIRRFHRGSNRYFKDDTFLPCACFPTYPDAGIPMWSFTWVLQVIDHYERFGADEGFEARLYDVEECFRRCDHHMSDRGLFAFYGAWNLIEWADNDLTPYGEVTANNFMLSYCYEKASKLMRTLGENEKADKYLEKCNAIRAAIEKYCYSDELNGYVDTVRDEYSYEIHKHFCEDRNKELLSLEEYKNLTRISVQTATFALLFGNVSGERAKICLEMVKNDVKKGHFITGTPANCPAHPTSMHREIVRIGSPFFMYYALRALFESGNEDMAVDVIRREWGEMLDDGLHTCVETFRREDGEWGRSAVHAWSAAPAVFLKTEVLGIKPLSPGYKTFTVCPKPCGLTSAEGSVPTPYGEIHVKWELNDGKMTINCVAPEECERIYT